MKPFWFGRCAINRRPVDFDLLVHSWKRRTDSANRILFAPLSKNRPNNHTHWQTIEPSFNLELVGTCPYLPELITIVLKFIAGSYIPNGFGLARASLCIPTTMVALCELKCTEVCLCLPFFIILGLMYKPKLALVWRWCDGLRPYLARTSQEAPRKVC